MGNCFSSEENAAKYASTGANAGASSGLVNNDSARSEASQALALLTGSNAYSTFVEIRIACKNLLKLDFMSKSDPMAVMFEEGPDGMKELGRTEILPDTLDPVFAAPVKVLYNFERVQNLVVRLYDVDRMKTAANTNLAQCNFMGESRFALSELVASKEQSLTLKMASAPQSQVIVRVEQQSSAREVITMRFVGQKLRDLEVMSKSDPYLEICKLQQGDVSTTSQAATSPVWQPVYRTEVLLNNLNPCWSPITIRATQLHNGDVYRPLLLRVYDYEANSKPQLMGQVEASGDKLQRCLTEGQALALADPGKPGRPMGQLMVQEYKITQQPSFLDYIQAGTELSFMVAVDFTASNRPPHDPASLHYIHATTPYENALTSVGRVLEFYDTDRMYPAFGFGGSRQGSTSHCFPLVDTHPDGYCAGVEGIRQAYRASLSTWGLSGPTLFAPVIRRACQLCQQPSPTLKYTVLLILTDGEIMDMNETIDAIITASSLPLSILIVGIGDASFRNMVALDSDKSKLSSNGRQAERDIVQFVEFKGYKNNPDALAAELLAELPGQFLAWTRTRGIMPPGWNPGSAATPAVAPTAPVH